MSLNLLPDYQDSNSAETDLDDLETTANIEYTIENREHLKRLEQEFLDDLATGYFVKDWLQTIMFNSFNVFITLYCIKIGIGLNFAAIAGFSVGSIPGLKNIGDNFRINTNSEDKGVGVKFNGSVLNGLIKLALSVSLTLSAVSEWKNVTWMAKQSHEMFMKQVDGYENPGKNTLGLDPNIAWYLAIAAGSLLVFKFTRDRDY